MSAVYELLEQPDLESPVVVLALDGWVDAGLGMQAARASLLQTLDTVTVATFDTDDLLDHRARRPVMHLADGILTGLTWPSTEVRAATDDDGNDLLLVVGAEPDHRWRAFSTSVVDLAMQFGSRMIVGLGAYPAPVPHTRPTRLACSASDPHLARFCSVRTTVDVPGGVHAAIERRGAEVGLPAIGLWAQVPHYASAMPSPAAAAALLDGLAQVATLRLDTEDLHVEAAANRARIDELIGANADHAELVRRLEAAWDAELSDVGNDLASEIERFLREQGGA